MRSDAASEDCHLPEFPELMLILAEKDDIVRAVSSGQCRILLEENQLEADDSRIQLRQIGLPSSIVGQPSLEYNEILLVLSDVQARPQRKQIIKRPQRLHQQHRLQPED